MAGDVPENLQQPLMDYCLDDVRTGSAIWRKLKSRANPKEAIMRGRYLKALAQVERRGIPADLARISHKTNRGRTGNRSKVLVFNPILNSLKPAAA